MKITLKTLKGQQLPLEVQPDMTVSGASRALLQIMLYLAFTSI